MDQQDTQRQRAQTEQHSIQRRDDAYVQADIEALLKDTEETRLRFMTQRRSRSFIAMTVGIIALLIGAGGFGWFLLVHYDFLSALASISVAIIIPIILNIWALRPIKAYRDSYKSVFMPRIGQAIGGLKFHPSRGISAKVLSKTGLIPSHDSYDAEDCFMGTYKGIRVILSEARLHKKKHLVFDGIFVLLELPSEVLEGHTIITADQDKAAKWAPTRWSKLQNVAFNTGNPAWDRLQVFSSAPDDARLLVGERLLKELAEASEVFDKSPLSTALFRKKFIFMMIPFEQNMFEACSVNVPVTTSQHALKCKREIERILEIVDVFELYCSDEKTTPETIG